MAGHQKNAELGELLVDLARCLLQYVGECWPWTGEDESDKRTIDELVARQKQSIGRLVELLNRRRRLIDFGAYPTDFTDLHFLALHHLLGRLVGNQQACVDMLAQAAGQCAGDEEAAALIDEVLSGERKNLDRLRDLAAQHTAGNAA